MHDRRPARIERLGARAGGEHLLVVLQGLGALVRGAGPAQLAVSIGEHDPGGVGVERLLGRQDSLLQAAAKSRCGSRSVRVPMLLASIEGSIGMGL